MKKFPFILLFFFLISAGADGSGEESSSEKGLRAINEDVIKAQLGFLSSDWMEGREAAEKGAYLASDYIASMLRLYGIAPAGDMFSAGAAGKKQSKQEKSYFQNFTLLKSTPGDLQIMKIKYTAQGASKIIDLAYKVDFIVRPGEPGVETEAPVVFAGYGYYDDSLKYNDFSNIDVKGKFILKFSGLPKFAGNITDFYALMQIRNRLDAKYRAMGAAGVIEFDPDAVVAGSPETRDFMNMSPSEGVAVQGGPYYRYTIPGKKFPESLPRVQVSVRVADAILSGSGTDIDEYRARADRNEKVSPPGLKERTIYLQTTSNTTQVNVRNVIGVIEGKDPDKYIVIGAHYDHVGMGNGYIWNGADDNGSGTVGVMTIARAFMAAGTKPECTVIIALWTAEEEGLLGSRYWVRNLSFPASRIKLNMNFDMISRYISDNEPNKVTMTYTSSFPWFRDITIANMKKYGIDLDVEYQPSPDPPGGTDHRSFVEMGVPVMRFKPGHREEYHTPKDEYRTLDWDIMEKIVKIGFLNTWELANSNWVE